MPFLDGGDRNRVDASARAAAQAGRLSSSTPPAAGHELDDL